MEWLSKERQTGNWIKGSDVFISEIDKGNSVSFRIHASVVDIIAKSHYITFAVENDRIYFDEANAINGWKLSPSGKNGFFFKIKTSLTPLKKVPVGNYALLFDKYNGYYYIDLTKSLNMPHFERR